MNENPMNENPMNESCSNADTLNYEKYKILREKHDSGNATITESIVLQSIEFHNPSYEKTYNSNRNPKIVK